VASDLDNKSNLTLSDKAINWLHQAAYFTEHNKSLDEVIWE